MIEEIETYDIKDQYGNVYGKSVPTNLDLMEKINEIIRYLNEKEDKKLLTRKNSTRSGRTSGTPPSRTC